MVAAGAGQQRGSQKLTRVANNFPGSDLGAKINAADKDLGNREGENQVRSGGTISTQVVINPKHTLRFGPGTYTLATELLSEGAFLLKSHTTVIGSRWDTNRARSYNSQPETLNFSIRY
ncbi:MAG: hypothetical protein ACR2H4_11625 [Pyrinomonadaceae bacterium]